MAPPKDIARSYPKRGITADVGFRSEPKFCGDGSAEYVGTNSLQFDGDHTFVNGFSVAGWYWVDGTQTYNYAGFAGTTIAWGFPANGTYLNFYQKATSTAHQTVGGTLTPKQWNHIAFTLSQDGLTVKAYLNGVELTITQPSVAIVLPSLTNIAEAGIAAFQHSASGAPLSLPYGGQMANQVWYDGVLTQDEVRQLMRAPNYTIASTIVTPQFYFELFSGITDSTGNATTVEDRGTTTTVYGVKRPQLPRGLDLTRGAAMARVYTGRALDQDGSVDRLQGTKFTDATATACTVSFWMYQRDGGPGRVIHNFGGGATAVDRFIAAMNAGSFLIAGEISSGNRLGFAISNLPLNQWHHVVFVLDGNGTTSLSTTILYLNGEKYDSPGAIGIIWETSTFDIGGTAHGYQNQLIAGVKVFNTKLTDAQARELYHNPEQVLPTGVSASNLRRYYPLSDYNDTGGTGGRHFRDMGADGEPLEDIGSCSMEFAQPAPCPQLGLQQSASRMSMYNTTNNTYYRSGVMSGTPFTNQATLSGWFIMQELPGTGAGDYNPIFILGKFQTNKDLLEVVYDNNSAHGTPNIWLTDGAGSVGVRYNHTFELGKLQHVVITTLTTSPYWQLWINGEKKTVSARSFSGSRTAWDFGDNKLSGGRWGDGPYGGVCHFIPVETSAWNTVLSDSEVTQVYNSGIPGDVSGIASANLQAWWKCDDLSEFKDFSGNGVSGTVTSGSVAPGLVSFPENASGSTLVGDFSMKRKGVSVLNCFDDPGAQRVRTEIPSGAGLQPSLTNGHTVSCWYRNQMQNTTSANNGTMVLGGNDGSNDRFILEAFNGNTFRGVYGAQTATSSTTISDNEWHHYAMVLDVTTASPTVRLYLDGVAVDTKSGTLSTTFPEGKVVIGGLSTTSSRGSFDYGLKGPIACPRIYAFQLSENEIKQIYHADERLLKGLNNE